MCTPNLVTHREGVFQLPSLFPHKFPTCCEAFEADGIILCEHVGMDEDEKEHN